MMAHTILKGGVFRALAVLLALALLLSAVGCGGGKNEPNTAGYAPNPSEQAEMELEATRKLIQQYGVSASVSLEMLGMTKKKQDAFLYENTCFSIVKDHGVYKDAPRRSDYLPVIFSRYGTAPIRTMGTYVYAVYETDGGMRVYLYFLRQDDYSHMNGRVILMSHTLRQSDFMGFQVGDTMDDVAQADPNIAVYRKIYDEANVDALVNSESKGWAITTMHLLRDGILRYCYELEPNSQPRRYVIREINYSPDFKLTELCGEFDYSILQQDYMA